jgi:hypothetical protein
LVGGSCKTGYTHCGTRITPTPENTLCLPEADVIAGLCPIVEVSFIASGQPADDKRRQGYTVVSAGNVTIAYSKEPTALPVQATKLSVGEPCVDPYQKPRIEVPSKPVFIGDVDYY